MIVTFGPCEVDLDRVEIRVGGAVTPVQPQVFDVIEYLIGHRDRVVTKDELLDNVWGDRFVSESTLTSRIKSARRVLGDDGRQQTVIKTVHGRGYRFVAPVELVEGQPQGAIPPASRPPPSPITLSADDWPLVGRYDELEQVRKCFDDGDVAGVLITGTHRSGRTRLANECLRRHDWGGAATARVSGLSSAADIPLAAIAHLVSPEVFGVEHASADLARAAIFGRARAELETSASQHGRLVVVIDDAEHLDDLTSALLGSLMAAGTIFGIVTQRSGPQRAPKFDELVRSSRLREIELRPLDETDVDILLYRVLEGPIDLGSLRRLGDLSQGRAGLLRDLVESSLASRSLAREDGVWRLVGQVTSTASRSWPPVELTDSAVRAAEMIALLSAIDLGDANEFFGADVIDELDRARLLTLDEVDGSAHVALSEPLLAQTIVASLSSLRARRHKLELMTALLGRRASLDNVATTIAWADELGQPIDELGALEAARRAMISGLDATADTLVAHLSRTDWKDSPEVTLIRAELCSRRGQWARAEELFASIDVDGIDEISAAFVLRQRASIEFHFRSRYDEAVAWLRAEEERASGRLRAALASHRIALLGIVGHADEVLDAARPLLDDLHGQTAFELLISVAQAHCLRGEWAEALAALDEYGRRLDGLPAANTQVPREAMLAVRLGVLLACGDLDEATAMVHQLPLMGKRTVRNWLPLTAASVEIAAGRPRAARELIRPTLEATRHQGPEHGRVVADAYFARTSVALGLTDEAEQGLRSAHSGISAVHEYNQWLVAAAIAEVSWGLGRGAEPVPLLLELAARASEVGAISYEAELLALAAAVDDDPATARRVVERVEELATRFGGRLWPIRAAHVRAVATGEDLSAVAEAYTAVGHRRLAEIASGLADE